MSTRRVIRGLLVIGFLLTPIFGLQDWLEVVPAFNQYVNIETQIVIKAMKDILLAAIVLLSVLDILRGRSFLRNPLVWLMLSLALIASLITSAEGKPFLALIGLRSLSPLLLIFIAYTYLDMAFIKRMRRVLVLVFMLECCAATLQILIGIPIGGRTFFNLAARPFGTFGNPWSLAAFMCFVLCLSIGCDVYWYGRPRRATQALALLAAFFVYMTSSGAGVLTLAVILLAYVLLLRRDHPYAKAAIAPAVLLTPLLAFYNLTCLTGRPNIFSTVRMRLGILDTFVDSSGLKEVLIGRDMGVGSNAAVTFTHLSSTGFGGAETLFISDSLYLSLISQAGLLFLLCFLVFNILLFQKAMRHRYQEMNPVAIMTIPAIMIASLGNNVLEFFPVNWLVCIVYGVVLRRDQTNAAYGPETVRRISESHHYGCEGPA